MKTTIIALAFIAALPSTALAQAAEISATGLKSKLLGAWGPNYRDVPSTKGEFVQLGYFSRDKVPLRLGRKVTTRYSSKGEQWTFGYEDEGYGEDGKINEYRNELTLINPSYRATLEKPRDKQTWLLHDYNPAVQGKATPKIYPRLLCPWLFCYNVWLPDWVAHKGFLITKAVEIPDGPSGKLLRISFTFDPSKLGPDSELPSHLPSGTLDVDEARACAVMGYEFNVKTQFSVGVARGTYEYEFAGDRPRLKRETVETRTKSPKFGEIHLKNVSEDTILTNPSVSDEEFYLSHYGLPEPVGIPRPRRSNFWLLISVAVVVLVIAFFARLYWKKRAAKPAI